MGLTKRKESYYVEFRVLDDGKWLSLARTSEGKLKRWKVGCRSKGEAKKQEAIIRTKLLSGQIESPTIIRAHAVTFQQWSDQYLNLEHIKALKSAQRRISVGHLLKYFGSVTLGDLSADDVRKYRSWRAEQGAAVQTINHDHATLANMLNIAMGEEFGLIARNVAVLVRRPNPNNERDRIATGEEWSALKRYGAPHLIQFLIIAYDLGPRRGELLKLEWLDVNIHRREFTLRHTKNREPRVVPMTDEVLAVFKQLWAEGRLDTERVFLYKGRPVTSLKTAFRAACRRAGVKCGRKDGGLTVHDFRHTASTNLRRAGVDTMTAMKIVGHKSEKMHRRYNLMTSEDLHGAASKLAEYKEANTLITPGIAETGSDDVTPCFKRVGA